jgi:superfamily II DNA or RNA helicase
VARFIHELALSTSPFTEALSTLTDRGLRRLLGARAFLRGTDYVRRGSVGGLAIGEATASGQVRGSEPSPYLVALRLTPTGFASDCSCPTFSKISGHCKHVAALLIALRDQVRPRSVAKGVGEADLDGDSERPHREREPVAGVRAGAARRNGGGGAAHAGQVGEPAAYLSHAEPRGLSGAGLGEHVQTYAGGYEGGRSNGQSGSASDAGNNGLGRRARRRAARAARGSQPAPSHARDYAHSDISSVGTSPMTTGVGQWLPEPMPPMPKKIEYRIQVRPQGLTVTVMNADARTPLMPSSLLPFLAQNPTADRDAIRALARLENAGPRRLGIEVRGEDASDLLPLLKGRKVVLEPQMMELRFGDESIRPRFDLELAEGGREVIVRASFQRAGDPRKFGLNQGAWFEGHPGWHIDAQEGVARPIDRRVSPSSVRRLMRSPTIREPVERLPELISQGLPKVALEVGAELPELSQVADVIDMVPTFRLRAGGSLVEARVALRAAYEDFEIDIRSDGMTPPVIVKAAEDGKAKRAQCIRCDIAAQQAASGRLRDLGLVPDEEGNGFILRGDEAIHFWTEGIGTLPDDWDLFVPDDLVDVQLRSETLGANARVSSGVDWLSLRLSFESEGIAVTQDELAKCLSEGRRYVRLADGSFARLDLERVRQVLLRQAEILATGGGQGNRLPLSQAGRIQDLLEQVGRSAVTDGAKDLFHKLRDIEEIKGIKKPRTLKATLRPYQEQGLQWLWFLHEIGSGGILADDMGLGKTVQTIGMMLAVKAADEKADKTFRALIVAPTSVVTNWLREMEKFAPTLKHALWHGGDRKERKEELEDADVIVTSYALLRRDEELLSKLKLRYVILDEAQNIKNPHSATARAAKRLKADRRLALSGTPIENRLSEIWSIFDFVSPGLLGPLDKFEERYARPIDNGDAKAASRLRATIHPFILRRTKSEVAKDLPEKIESDQFCELTGEQGALYAAVLKEVRAQVMGEVERQGMGKAHIQILAGLTRLRQAACDPRLLGLPREFTDEDSGKLHALRELLETCVAGGHRVLVFSQFVSMLTLIRRALEADKIAYEYLDGSTKDRQARVENFQRDDGPPVFLISLKAGGSGLNLTAADTVIHFDPWWNPAVEDQATDRAHRIGQTRVVNTYRLIAKGTIEEKILELGGKKRELVGAVLSEDMGGAKKLTKTDLESLFND